MSACISSHGEYSEHTFEEGVTACVMCGGMPDEVLIEGTWFRVDAFPEALTAFIRAANEAEQKLKEAEMELKAERRLVREALLLRQPDASATQQSSRDIWRESAISWERHAQRLERVLDEAYDEDCGLTTWHNHPDLGLKERYESRLGGDDE